MTAPTYPSADPAHRRADMLVHLVGLVLILIAGSVLIHRVAQAYSMSMVLGVLVYFLAALASNLASAAYHFAPWHDHRTLLRRIDHAAIYPSISGTFTPFFVFASTTWTMILLVLCWGLTALAMWNKITAKTVKSKWSTASYLGLGALGLSALPSLGNVPLEVLWSIIAGAVFYVVGTAFYTRKSIPFRYPIWHSFVNLGGICMFTGIWMALFL